MYFDKDGIVVESSSKLYSGVPQIEGLKFTSIVLGSKLDAGDDSVFSDILELTQAFEKYNLDIDKVYFDSSYNVTLYMNEVKIILGNAAFEMCPTGFYSVSGNIFITIQILTMVNNMTRIFLTYFVVRSIFIRIDTPSCISLFSTR